MAWRWRVLPAGALVELLWRWPWGRTRVQPSAASWEFRHGMEGNGVTSSLHPTAELFSSIFFSAFYMLHQCWSGSSWPGPRGWGWGWPGEMDWASKTPNPTQTLNLSALVTPDLMSSLVGWIPYVELIHLRWALEDIPSPREGQWLRILALSQTDLAWCLLSVWFAQTINLLASVSSSIKWGFLVCLREWNKIM